MARGAAVLTSTSKAVILAAGRGTRMQRPDPGARADATQRAAADAGLKGMIPIERPFLEYGISALADAGITDVCLVIGGSPDHQAVRDHFERSVRPQRVRIHFAVQDVARGSADAVLAAESFGGDDHVVVVNSDNYYPVHTLAALRELSAARLAGVAAFERDALVTLGNVDPDRVRQYSVLDIDDHGLLRRIVEKPGAAEVAARGENVFVGMNSWSLPPEIYRACRSIGPSSRGELELPQAVQYALDTLGVPFRALEFRDGVLDLSKRGDIATVAARLRGVVPRL